MKEVLGSTSSMGNKGEMKMKNLYKGKRGADTQKILVINGPNLNLLGARKTSVYGTDTLADIEEMIRNEAEKLGLNAGFLQSNHEGVIIDAIHAAIDTYDLIIINPGAFAHYSYAIRDAIESVEIPVIEVHISNIYAREEFRNTSVISPVCNGSISGFGSTGYYLAVHAADRILMEQENELYSKQAFKTSANIKG